MNKQREKIMDYIEATGSITTMEAMSLGIASPTKRFSELNKMYGLKKEWVYCLNRDGEKTRYIRYSL